MLNVAHSDSLETLQELDLRILPLPQDKVGEAANVLTLALKFNPVQLSVYGNISIEVEERMFEKFQKILMHPVGQVYVAQTLAGKIVGVYRRKECLGRAQSFFPAAAIPQNLTSILQRENYWYEVWRQNEPTQSHSHLGPIGVLPNFQHQGIGGQLLKHYCHYLNQANLPAYLEADKWKNVQFYQRFGFQVCKKSRLFDAETYFMWREIF